MEVRVVGIFPVTNSPVILRTFTNGSFPPTQELVQQERLLTNRLNTFSTKRAKKGEGRIEIIDVRKIPTFKILKNLSVLTEIKQVWKDEHSQFSSINILGVGKVTKKALVTSGTSFLPVIERIPVSEIRKKIRGATVGEEISLFNVYTSSVHVKDKWMDLRDFIPRDHLDYGLICALSFVLTFSPPF